MQPDLTVSIISADNVDLLLPCLRSVFENTHHIVLEVYVVDNASTDSSAAAVKASFPQVKVIRNEVRQGFSTNNNLVLGQGQGRYLMLLNDDTLVLDGALDRMVEFMDAHPQAGAVGSSLFRPDGRLEPAFAYFTHPFLEGLWPSGEWSYRLVSFVDGPLHVHRVCGAAMLVRRDTIAQVGVLDTAFDPIYSEEVDWCYRIRQAGWRIYSLPEARIIHYGSRTMNRIIPRKYELVLSHKTLFFRKHKGVVATSIYKATLFVSTAIKLAGWTVVSLLPGNHQASDEKRKLHWYLLRRIPSF